jgi:DNA repair photolyase
MGYEVRVRLDPILTPDNWENYYESFVADVKKRGIKFRYWTLGTYREKNGQLDAWRERWGLLPIEWEQREGDLVKDGTHWHLPEPKRIATYKKVKRFIRREYRRARVSLCKETHLVRKAVSLCNGDCNCLV